MATSRFGSVGRFFAGAWRLLDTSRRVVFNLLFLALLIVLVAAIVSGGGPSLKDNTTLVLDLHGSLVEQRATNLRDDLQAQALGSSADGGSTQLRDVLTVLDAAAKDPKIARVLLVLDDMHPTGVPMLREVASAIDRFKAGGKKVAAWGSSYDQSQYYLASHADEVWLHPMGMVMLKGMGHYRNYYKDALDRLGVSANVLRVGSYKSFGETFTSNAPSKEAIEADTLVYGGLWANYTEGIEKARKLPAGSVAKGIDELPQRFAAVGGDTAKLALEGKLVDGLKTRDEVRELMIQRGARDDRVKSFRQIGFNDYLAKQRPRLTGDAVGVVVASGEIVDGIAPGGKVGGISTAELIRRARDDDSIKAIVLRVDSPGGSAFASEQIRRELEVTRKAGKPVVVSMGNVAASGGYWISMSSDEVIADPATITGSIGVIAMLPTAEKALEKLSLHTGGVSTTWLDGAYDPRRGLDPRFAQIVQAAIEHAYGEFTGKAAAARKTDAKKIDEVAQGRVWTGTQAKERNLVDRLGSYGDALAAAAKLAKLPEGYRVAYVEREPGRLDRLLSLFGGSPGAHAIAEQLVQRTMGPLGSGAPAGAVREAAQDLGWLADLTEGRRPYTVVTHCLCGVTP